MTWTELKGSFIMESIRPHNTTAVATHIRETKHTQTLSFSSIMPPQTALYRRITLAHNCPEHVLHYSGRFWRWAARCALQSWSDLIRLQRRSRSLECQLMRWLRQMSTNRAQRNQTKKQTYKFRTINVLVQNTNENTDSCFSKAVHCRRRVRKIQTRTVCEGIFIEKLNEEKTLIGCWITVGLLMKS